MTTILHKRGTGQPSPDELKVGEIAIDTLTGTLYTKQSDGSVVEIGGGSEGGGDVSCNIPILDSPPANPELGEQWFSSTDGYLYVWYGAEWVAIGGAGGGNGGGSGGDSGGDGGGDPFWSSVGLLINGDGEANASQNIVDATNKHQLVVDGAKINTSVFKYGTGSVVFGGGTAEKVATAATVDLQLGTGDWTIEFWVWFNALNNGQTQYIFDWRTASAASNSFLAQEASGSWTYWNGEGKSVATGFSAGTFENSKWHHVAIVRSGGAIYFYVDGIETSGGVQDATNYNSSNLTIGNRYSGNNSLNGYIDDFRITKGIVRYTADFTPPEKHPTKEAVKRAVVSNSVATDISEEPIYAGDNDADLS